MPLSASRVFSLLCALSFLIFSLPVLAQRQVATLHPPKTLVWQRTSSSARTPDGPVLYQLLFRLPDATGDVSGKFPNLTVVGLRGFPVSSTAPADGQVLTFDSGGGSWRPATLSAGNLPDLSGLYVDLISPQFIMGDKNFGGNVFFFNTIQGNAMSANFANSANSATTATTANNALKLGGNLASAYYTSAQSNALYLQLTGGFMTGNLNGTIANFSGTGSFGDTLTAAGGLQVTPTGTATPSNGFNSNFQDLIGSAYDSLSGFARQQRFRWQVEPVNNNAASASGTLNLLFGVNPISETGLSIDSHGIVTFAPGQTFPGSSGVLSLGVNPPLASSGGQNPTLSLSTVDIAHGGTGIANGPISAGQFLRSTGAGTWAVGTIQAGDLPAMPAWSLAGNAATGCGASPCATFLGTTDDSALELRVNNTRAYRIEPAVINGQPVPNIIGGSTGNNVTPGAVGATIAGGGSSCAICFNEVTDDFGTVGGGTGNRAGDNSGSTSDGIATYATVAGGLNNTASGNSSTVIGGFGNTASGFGSTVAGGSSNFATGDFSFVGGCSANSNNQPGSFVWADYTGSGICEALLATAPRQFIARARGGVIFYTSTGSQTGVQVAPGGGSWSAVSDRNVKELFSAVDTRQLLAQVLALPITTWNYKSQPAGIRHIGPMAQDFFAAFNVGEDDKHITTIDEGGVALAAIQGLNEKLQDEVRQKDAEVAALASEVRALRAEMDELKNEIRARASGNRVIGESGN